MPIVLAQRPKISVGDVDVVSIDFSNYLDAGELLTGTPTVAEVDTSDLTLASKVINTTTLVILLNQAVIAGQAVQFKVSGQKAGKKYRIRVTAVTNGTVPRTKVVDVILEVVQ